MIKEAVKKLPGIRTLVAQRDQFRIALEETQAELWDARGAKSVLEAGLAAAQRERDEKEAELGRLQKLQGFAPPGHFYSPIPDLEVIRHDEQRVFGTVPRSVPGIDLREDEQLALLKQFVPFYKELPFADEAKAGLRFRYDNPAYSYSDAILLYCMMRHVRPRRIIEVGSGFSSCVMLDTNELFLDNAIAMTFIEPFPELLLSLVKPADAERIGVIPSRLQDVGLETFDALEANDILFVDSTHVSKVGSDVNRILLEILPRLKPGVHVHFHDIFFPFEYPAEWVFEGRAWNEAYMLRAFLAFNAGFSIVLMNTFMEYFHPEFFHQHLPLCMKNTGGSIWIRKN